ncbi:MAG TPA: MFS transporter, partial [Dehalococcoidia bacterium]|nr:MFS transporter [Dehalococcoidia bacterium]
LYGIVSIVGNLASSFSDRLGRANTFFLGSIGAIVGLGLLIATRDTSQPWLLYVYGLAFGFSMGMNGPTLTATAADIFEGRHFGAINGLIVAGFGLGGGLGPWLGGYVYDTFGNYIPALLVAMVAVAVSSLLIWGAVRAGPPRPKRS